MNNKQIIDTYHQALWEQKDLSAIDRHFENDAIIHSAIESTRGTDNMKTVVEQWLQAFPDLVAHWEDTICEGNKVVSRWQAQGTQLGEFLGHPPSGKTVSYSGINIYELDADKIKQYWCVINMQHLLDQLTT